MLNKRIKTSVLVALVMISTSGVLTVNADQQINQSDETKNNIEATHQESRLVKDMDENELRTEINKLLKKYGYEVENENLTKKVKSDLEFDTIEEFEDFLQQSEKEYEENKVVIEEVNLDEIEQNNISNKKISERATYSHHFQEDSKQWTVFYKRNMKMNYETKKNSNGSRAFVRVYNRNAYPTGFTVGTWKVHPGGYTQTYSSKYNNRDTVTNKVNGQWTATASVGGINVGYTKDQTWTFILWIR